MRDEARCLAQETKPLASIRDGLRTEWLMFRDHRNPTVRQNLRPKMNT